MHHTPRGSSWPYSARQPMELHHAEWSLRSVRAFANRCRRPAIRGCDCVRGRRRSALCRNLMPCPVSPCHLSRFDALFFAPAEPAAPPSPATHGPVPLQGTTWSTRRLPGRQSQGGSSTVRRRSSRAGSSWLSSASWDETHQSGPGSGMISISAPGGDETNIDWWWMKYR